jgi:hypothetical protein
MMSWMTIVNSSSTITLSHPISLHSFTTPQLHHDQVRYVGVTLEESLSISTGLATRPSRLAPKKCINKSIWLAAGGHLPWVHHGYLPGANQIDFFMHFLGCEYRWLGFIWTRFLLVIIPLVFSCSPTSTDWMHTTKLVLH